LKLLEAEDKVSVFKREVSLKLPFSEAPTGGSPGGEGVVIKGVFLGHLATIS